MHNKDENVKKSLNASFLDGVFASGMTGFTQEYFTPFLLLLGATAKHVGALTAFSNLFNSLIQLKSADLTERLKSRRKIINIFVFFQALMLLPMLSIAISRGTRPIIFIGIVVLFTCFGAIVMPPWASLMSDLVEQDKRGQYFGWRNKILGFITVVITFLAGLTLNYMRKVNIFYGFAIIFGFAFIFRIISLYFLTKMHEPYLEHKREHCFTFFDFLSRMKKSNFARFVLFVAMINFSVNLAAPFFVVLMIRDLHFSYLLYTIITIVATTTTFLTINRWGKHADKIGNLKVIKFSALLITTLPLLWIINQNPLFLVFVQLFGGFAWAGFNLCTSNFIYDAVIPQKRTRCISYFNAINGLAIFFGAIIGGFLVEKLPFIFGYKILTLFLISGILRIVVAVTMPIKLKEVRPVEKIRNNQLFLSMLGIRSII